MNWKIIIKPICILAGLALLMYCPEKVKAEALGAGMKDGEYSIEVNLAGGGGRESIVSPTWLFIENGVMQARILWSSADFDRMKLGEKSFPNETLDGTNSSFTIPVTALDEPVEVMAETAILGKPQDVPFTLTFYGETVASKDRVPQEAAKKVIAIALAIMIGGGILNYYVKRKQRR